MWSFQVRQESCGSALPAYRTNVSQCGMMKMLKRHQTGLSHLGYFGFRIRSEAWCGADRLRKEAVVPPPSSGCRAWTSLSRHPSGATDSTPACASAPGTAGGSGGARCGVARAGLDAGFPARRLPDPQERRPAGPPRRPGKATQDSSPERGPSSGSRRTARRARCIHISPETPESAPYSVSQIHGNSLQDRDCSVAK